MGNTLLRLSAESSPERRPLIMQQEETSMNFIKPGVVALALAALAGCVAVPADPYYSAAPAAYYPPAPAYYPAPVYYGAPAYIGPSIGIGISSTWRGGHG